ncbi:MAG: ABC transporter ATP-binding protein [Chloroflexi bacterium]|nr:ABC transporter ATP-binding protein [Chloroflexota bacterium]
MIFAENLTKQFDQFVAVDGVNLDVPQGNVLVLLGPNGAGKTTTVRMLTSILRPTRGVAQVAGYDVVKEARQVRSVVGVLTEQHGLYGRMNADEYLDFFGQLYGLERNHSRQRSLELLEQFELAEDRKKRLSSYSKGMRQKLSLARALLHQPPVLLLDEPTSAMDPESARMVRDAISSLRSADRTIVLCTHNLAEAEELADQVAIIRKGKIIRWGELNELKQQLLGPTQFEAVLSTHVDGWQGRLPEGVSLTQREGYRLQFQIRDPQNTNPALLRGLLADQLDVISFQEVPHSLESAYIEAVRLAKED